MVCKFPFENVIKDFIFRKGLVLFGKKMFPKATTTFLNNIFALVANALKRCCHTFVE